MYSIIVIQRSLYILQQRQAEEKGLELNILLSPEKYVHEAILPIINFVFILERVRQSTKKISKVEVLVNR